MHTCTCMRLTTQLQCPASHPIYLWACQNINVGRSYTPAFFVAKHDKHPMTRPFIPPATRLPGRVWPYPIL